METLLFRIFNYNIQEKYQIKDFRDLEERLRKRDIFVINRLFTEGTLDDLVLIVGKTKLSWKDLKKIYLSPENVSKKTEFNYLFERLLEDV